MNAIRTLCVFCLLLGAPSAHAQPVTTLKQRASVEPWERPITIEAIAGYSSSTGLAGVMLEVAPLRYLALVAGFGYGDGWRAGTGVRLRLPTPRIFAFELGGTFSFGRDGFFWGPNVQSELAMTFRFDSGLQLRFFGGVDLVLAGADSRTTPVGGIGVGYAF